MNLPLPYGLIKDLFSKTAKYSARELNAQYNNFEFLKTIGLSPLEDSHLSAYYHALYNFICLGFHEEWSYILSEKDVIESYEKEFVYNQTYEGYFREMIDANVHTNRNLKELKKLQEIDDETYDVFLKELESVEAKLFRNLSYTKRIQNQRIKEIHSKIYGTELTQAVKRVLDRSIKRYLNKERRRISKTRDNLNKFYIEVLGEKSELDISATEFRDRLFQEDAENKIDGDSNESIELINDKITNLANTISRLFLRGNPGTGKTESLHKIFNDNIERKYLNISGAKIPILIKAKGYDKKGAIKRTILKILKVKKDYFDDLMDSYDLLIMIDGLNEVKPSLIDHARTEIQELMDDYDNPSYIITSRKYDFESYRIEDAKNLEIKIYDVLPLDEKKHIIPYINKVFDKKRSKQIWQFIRRKENTELRKLVSNPMYLTMLLVVAKESERKRIPQSKGELYHKFMEELLNWESKKKKSWNPSLTFSIKNKKKYISELAYHIITKRTLTEIEMEDILSKKIKNDERVEQFVKELIQNHLIESDEEGKFSFVHDTYSEYFAAVWLCKHFERHLELPIDIGEQQWFESILMCSDIFRRAQVLDAYLDYLLLGGNKKDKWNQESNIFRVAETQAIPSQAKTVYRLSVPKEHNNKYLSVGCSVAYNIFKKSNRKNREVYYRKAERILSNYLVFWMDYYGKTDRMIIPIDNLFAAIGALSSRKIYRKVFCDIDWISVWGKLNFEPLARFEDPAFSNGGVHFSNEEDTTSSNDTFQFSNGREAALSNGGIQFSEEEIDRLNEVSRLSLNAFIHNLNDFTGFYFYLIKDIPKYKNQEEGKSKEKNNKNSLFFKTFSKEYDHLKDKLLSDTAKNNIELLKYYYGSSYDEETGSYDYTVLKKIGEREIDFYLDKVKEAKVEEEEIAGYLRNHSLLSTDAKKQMDDLSGLEEKIDFFQKNRISNDSNIFDDLALAKEYVATKQYTKATQHFEKVLKLAPRNPDGLHFLVRHYKYTENYNDGLRILKEAEKDGAKTAFIVSSIAEFYKKKGDFEMSKNYFNSYRRNFGESPYALLGLASVHTALEEDEEAINYADQLLNYSSFPSFYYSLLGEIYRKNDRLEQAIHCFKKYLKFDTKNAIIWGNIGNCYRILKETEKALEAFLKEYNLTTNNFHCLVSIGDSYLHLSKYDKALKWFKKAEKININDRLLLNVIGCYRNESNFNAAIQYIRKHLKKQPNNPFLISNLADCYKKIGNHEKAIQYFERQIKMQPNNIIVLASLADSYKKVGNFKKAIEYFERQIKLDSDNTFSIRNLADCYKRVGDFDKAIEFSERYIDLEPQNPKSFGSIADSYKKNKNYKKAIEYFQKQIELDPENTLSIGNLADCYKKVGNLDKAIELFEQEIKLDPKNVLSLSNLIGCYIRKATRYEKKAESVILKNIFSNNKEKFEKNISKMNVTVKYLEKIVQTEPSNLIALFKLANYYREKGRFKKAIKYLEKIVEIEPENIIVIDDLADLYHKQSQVYMKKKNKIENSQPKNINEILIRNAKRLISQKKIENDENQIIQIILSVMLDNKNIYKALKKEGLNLSVFKQLIEVFIEDFNLINFGQVKFVDFLRVICKNSGIGVFRGEKGDPKLGIRSEGLEGLELLPDLERINIQTPEGYRKILGYKKPRYLLPSKETIVEVVNTLVNQKFESISIEQLIEEISKLMEKEDNSDEVKKSIMLLVATESFVLEEEDAALVDQKITLKEDFNNNPSALLEYLRVKFEEKLTTVLKDDVDEKLIGELA